jgi:hypothetical protein
VPDEATQTERERMGMDDSGEMDYESVVVSPDGRMQSAAGKKLSKDSQVCAYYESSFRRKYYEQIHKKL